jgi:hypothetical protein
MIGCLLPYQLHARRTEARRKHDHAAVRDTATPFLVKSLNSTRGKAPPITWLAVLSKLERGISIPAANQPSMCYQPLAICRFEYWLLLQRRPALPASISCSNQPQAKSSLAKLLIRTSKCASSLQGKLCQRLLSPRGKSPRSPTRVLVSALTQEELKRVVPVHTVKSG